jgi:hypothetical protein
MEDPRTDIFRYLQEDLNLLVDISNQIIQRNKSLVDEYMKQTPMEGYALIRQVMRDWMRAALTADEMYGRHLTTMRVHVALMVLEEVSMLNCPNIQDLEKLEIFYSLGWARGILTFADPKSTALDDMATAMHSYVCSDAQKPRHKRDKEKREALTEPFRQYVRDRLKNNYQGSAPALVDAILRKKDFEELAKATRTGYENEKTQRAFIKKRKLEDFVREEIRRMHRSS